jgi:hypothetical protein
MFALDLVELRSAVKSDTRSRPPADGIFGSAQAPMAGAHPYDCVGILPDNLGHIERLRATTRAQLALAP